jgi:hypothetical protein
VLRQQPAEAVDVGRLCQAVPQRNTTTPPPRLAIQHGYGPCVLSDQHGCGCWEFGTKKRPFPKAPSQLAQPMQLRFLFHDLTRDWVSWL